MSTMRTGVAAAVASVVGYVNRPYSPTYLFQNGEQGFWYDPSDFSTLFQDAVGTTPVTAVEQPCSLMLDKRLGLVLGSELVTIPNINGVAIGGPSVTSYSTGGNTVTSGVFYKISFSVENYSGTGDVGISSSSFGTSVRVSANGTFSFVAPASATATLTVFTRSTNTANFRNISVRELPGNHAFTPAAASTARPTVSARVNQLVATEDITNAAWIKTNSSVTANITTAPNGTATADVVIPNTSNAGHDVRLGTASVTSPGTNVQAVLSVYAKAAGYNFIRLQLSTNISGNPLAYFDLANGSVGTVSNNNGTVVNTSIVAVGNGWYRCSVTANPDSGAAFVQPIFLVSNADNTGTFTGDGTSGIYIWGADLRVSNDGVGIPPYQRVNTASDYDTVGFPVYLRPDGSNDYMLTNSIDFTGTDKMTLCAGVRKLSDAAAGVVCELGTNVDSVNGSFGLLAPGTATNDIRWRNRGTATVSATQTGISAPVTAVLTGSSSISDDVAVLRNNTVQVASSTGDQGTGNYGNYAVYLFSRAGTASFFNGRFYGGVGRGAQSNDQQIAALEAYMNTKTAAY